MCFLDFTLAMENIATPEGMGWIFKILDVKNDKYLDESTLRYFIKDCTTRAFIAGLDVVDRTDLVNQLFDMVSPKQRDCITLADLKECKVGGVVLKMLIDFRHLTNSISKIRFAITGSNHSSIPGASWTLC